MKPKLLKTQLLIIAKRGTKSKVLDHYAGWYSFDEPCSMPDNERLDYKTCDVYQGQKIS